MQQSYSDARQISYAAFHTHQNKPHPAHSPVITPALPSIHQNVVRYRFLATCLDQQGETVIGSKATPEHQHLDQNMWLQFSQCLARRNCS